MNGIGVVFLPQLPPERLCSVAQAADEAGLAELWFWEDCFWQSGIASAAAALAWTRRLRVGIGLLPAPLRNVALTAMEIATLERLFPGRARIAVGHGMQDWMRQVGARVESPLSFLREYVEALRALLAGDEVTTQGRYVRLDHVALDWPPAVTPPVLMGAVGPRTLRLSGEQADGTVLTAGTTPDGARRARALVEEGRAAAGRSGPHHMVVYLHAARGADAGARLAEEYQRWGEDPSDDIGAGGDGAAVAAAVRRWAAAGATTVVLQPTADETDLEGFVRFVGVDVQRSLATA